MRFTVVGADKESGNDVSITLVAKDRATAEAEAHERGVLVASITPLPEVEKDSIELIEETPAGNGEAAHGSITLSANSPSGATQPRDGTAPAAGVGAAGSHSDAAMEYHVVMNQAIYLLEVAVNKYIKDGWEPQGGLTIGISNNAMQYFQALVRKKKT